MAEAGRHVSLPGVNKLPLFKKKNQEFILMVYSKSINTTARKVGVYMQLLYVYVLKKNL